MQEPLIQQACDWLDGQQQAMVDCLAALVNMASPSYATNALIQGIF